MMCENDKNPVPDLSQIISLEQASQLFGLSHGHLALLIRKKLLWGIKIGRNWLTTEQAIKDYLASNPKPGPKKNQD